MFAAEFRELVSGNLRGPRAQLLRWGLRAAEVPYRFAVALRNRAYDHGVLHVHRVDVPVVSVGNLTLGGTGKTPMVAWLADWFGQRSIRVTLISRGYGAEPERPNDEAEELALRMPHIPHIQNPNRHQAARLAIDQHHCQLIVLDDGFQHRRLARDLDIVLLDAVEPFGYLHVFPRGMLREPLEGLSRADVIGLSRADMVDVPTRAAVRDAVGKMAPAATWCELMHAPRELVNAEGHTAPLEMLAGRRVAAFCGLGNPAGFHHTLQHCGYDVVALRDFADHHTFQPTDIESLAQWAVDSGADAVVCTQKDLVKIQACQLGQKALWAVSIDLKLIGGSNELHSRLEQLLASHRLPQSD